MCTVHCTSVRTVHDDQKIEGNGDIKGATYQVAINMPLYEFYSRWLLPY